MSSSYDKKWHAYPGDKAIHNVDLPPNIPGVLIVPKRYLHADVVAPTVVHEVSQLSATTRKQVFSTSKAHVAAIEYHQPDSLQRGEPGVRQSSS